VTVNGIFRLCENFKLIKAVYKWEAVPGSAPTYTVALENGGQSVLNNRKVLHVTLPFTVYAGGTCGILGGVLSTCAISPPR
jgi:hypothetical protein